MPTIVIIYKRDKYNILEVKNQQNIFQHLSFKSTWNGMLSWGEHAKRFD